MTSSSSPAIPGYTFDTCRGSSAFGAVWKALWNGEFECAVKTLTPGMWHPQYLSWCLERLRREGERTDLVRVYSYDLANDPPHIAMALMPEGTVTLEQLSGRLPARDAWVLLDQLAATLAWLHSEGVVHTGLSSGNVFVCSGPSGDPVVLVSDVGQGWLSDAPVTRLHGQLAFIAPEHWRDATKLLQEGRAQGRDVYAFGVIAWRLLTGSWPRGGKVFDAIAGSQAEDLNLQTGPFAEWLEKEEAAAWPSEAANDEEKARRELVLKCLAMDAAERFSDMKAVREALQLCPLPAPAVAVAVDSLAEEADTDANGDGKVDSADAFTDGEQAPPRRRSFRLPFPKLSFSLRRARASAEAAPAEGAASALTVPNILRWRVATGIAALAFVSATAWALKERSDRTDAARDRDDLRLAKEDLAARLPRAEAAAAHAASEAQAARNEQAGAARRSAVELVIGVLASEPVEEPQRPLWRTGVRAVAEQVRAVLENAPADAAGMEARWQFARIKHALGDDAGALPVLEKLTRDLEAAAIAAGTEFPAELVRLTGYASALTGVILSAQNRTEDAMPHLRKASDSFERWLASHSNDTDASRALARNLLLEGRCLGVRNQIVQARDALMKVEGLIGKPGDSTFKPQDNFILADVHMELGRLDAAEAAALPATEPDAKDKAAALYDSAASRLSDGLNILITYDKNEDNQSVACRARMGRAYHELGRMLAKTGGPNSAGDAIQSCKESALVYTEISREFPDNTDFKFDLAMLYNDVAQLIRTLPPPVASARESLEYQKFSVDVLTDLDKRMPLNTKIRLALATSLTLNGELLEQSNDPKGPGKDQVKTRADALARHTEAITITADLLTEATLAERDRREARRVSARAWTGTAGLHERAGHREQAVDALNKALAEWESSPVEDPADKEMMAWVQGKLKKLK